MTKKLRLKKLGPNIYCIVASSHHLLASTFVRLQEFYESPYKQIKGKHFTLTHFKSLYAKDKGGFTYYEDWAGFNVPGNVVLEFFHKFKDLSPKERRLKKLLTDALKSSIRFYVIGVPRRSNQDVVSHELAHAFYYTMPSFKRAMRVAIKRISPKVKRQVFSKLREMKYCNNVLPDELQAYLATTKMRHLKEFFGYGITIFHTLPFRRVFNSFRE